MNVTFKSSSALFTTIVLGLAACGGETGQVDDTDAGAVEADAAGDVGEDSGQPACQTTLLGPGQEPFETLAEYCFFGGATAAHTPNDDVLPYDVNSTLFADDSLKMRFIALPEGTSIRFRTEERWEWPIGATLVKTFYYPVDDRDPDGARRLLETRLLVNEGDDGWESYSYRWNEEQTEAVFTKLGSWVDLDRTDTDGEPIETRYRIPDQNSCKNCHAQDDVTVPLGPRTWQMNKLYPYRDGEANQLEKMKELGWLEGMDAEAEAHPALPDPHGDADLDLRARSYLEANCGHCHNPAGAGGPSGLDLSWTAEDPYDYGVCKRPVAAGEGSGGLFYDIYPGDASQSIMVFRMESEDPGFKMPELPTLTSHEAGVVLVSEWIDQMEPAGCPE